MKQLRELLPMSIPLKWSKEYHQQKFGILRPKYNEDCKDLQTEDQINQEPASSTKFYDQISG